MRSRTSFGDVAFLVVVACMVGACAVHAASPREPSPPTMPEPPRVYLETRYVPPGGRTIAIKAGGNLQTALNDARPGDVITLEAGVTFTGPVTLPLKRGEGWIVVRSSTADANLPPEGTRITPAYGGVLPKIVAPGRNEPAVRTAPGAHHFRFIGIEFKKASPDVETPVLLQLGDGSRAQNELGKVPHHLIFDRVYVHGERTSGVKHCILLNSAASAVIDSHVSDCKIVGFDSQAIVGYNGPGPFKIVNNYLEGAGENVMFGGGDPRIPNLVPSDIEVRRNHFNKPLSWKTGDPGYTGSHWTVKNLFELKNAQRVLVDGNLFEQNWPDAQAGFAIVFTPRNQDGGAPWSVVQDVTFTNNIVRHSAHGITILGHDDNYPSQRSRRILVQNNLFEDVGPARWGGGGRLFQIIAGAEDVVIEHNTAFHSGIILLADGAPNVRVVFRHNIVQHNEYGVHNTVAGANKYFPDWVFVHNILIGTPPSLARNYPPGNFFPESVTDVGFVNPAEGNYRLTAASPFRRGRSNAKDIGVDIDAISRAAAGMAEGRASGRN